MHQHADPLRSVLFLDREEEAPKGRALGEMGLGQSFNLCFAASLVFVHYLLNCGKIMESDGNQVQGPLYKHAHYLCQLVGIEEFWHLYIGLCVLLENFFVFAHLLK